ncbi:HupE/UreJ family protein [Acinetobacter variabilis]|uniref:HupE/UreJ family protein n=1 Tax=Acinetobacter variabilis TaxID=70346 RepID=UPI000F6921FF|nr:HupE/UreJ family protein [Acinetobacter variabilis]QXR18083.1 HupE/UreJ family protein [Acinetobacter variabilis]
MRLFKQLLVAGIAALPMLAMAHAGHDHHNGFWSGFVHPFTGLDHLMMAIAFGVLMWTTNQRWKITGLIGLAVAMVAGFVLGSKGLLSTSLAESGIIASLVILAVALWTKSNKVLPVAAILLASFHGVAHGSELGQGGHVSLLIIGMVSAMALIYGAGLALGAFVKKYVPYGKQIVGGLAAVVAVIGLA